MVKKKLFYYCNLIALLMSIVLFGFTFGLSGVLLAVVFQICLGALLLLGFIPVVGVVLYSWLAWFNLIPWLLAVFGAEWAWPVTAMFVFNLIVSIGCTFHAIIRIFTVYWRF